MKEQFEKIHIEKYIRSNPPTNLVNLIHDLLSSEDNRIALAMKVSDDMKSAANLLSMSERSLYRKVEAPKDLVGEENN